MSDLDEIAAMPLTEWEREIVDVALVRVRELEAALRQAASEAQQILDVLTEGETNPNAASGYGYEHMGDFARDVQPLCQRLVALAASPEERGETCSICGKPDHRTRACPHDVTAITPAAGGAEGDTDAA